MLLKTVKGKPNKVHIAPELEEAQGQHIWTREAGYQAATLDPSQTEYPKMLYKPRFTASEIIKKSLMEINRIKDPDKKKAAYLEAVANLSETGADIRVFPMEMPEPEMLNSLLRIIGAKMATFEKETWLAENPQKTGAEYNLFAKSPLTITVKSRDEEDEARDDGWLSTYNFASKKVA